MQSQPVVQILNIIPRGNSAGDSQAFLVAYAIIPMLHLILLDWPVIPDSHVHPAFFIVVPLNRQAMRLVNVI